MEGRETQRIVERLATGRWYRVRQAHANDAQIKRKDDRWTPQALIAREYQKELYTYAMQRNTICALPTGSGKTFVAVMVAKALLREEKDTVFVLCPTQALAEQQQRYFLRYGGDDRVRVVHGGHDVDDWHAQRWRTELASYKVIVWTFGALHNAVIHGFVSFDDVRLLVVDECHHAIVGEGPLAQLMPLVPRNNGTSLRVLGLTASPLVSMPKSMDEALARLETVMCNAKVCCPYVPSERILRESVKALAEEAKPLELMAVLRRKMESVSCMRAIIFVKQRLCTVELAQFLSSQGIKAAAVVGTNSCTRTEGAASTASAITQVLAEFEEGNVQVVVATSVLEEGIDAPECNLVVLYDGVETPRMFIQAKGRCRANQRELVVFLPQGGAKAHQRYEKACALERELFVYIQRRFERNVDVCSGFTVEEAEGMGDDSDDSALLIESTSARADLRTSVSLLNQFSQTLAASSEKPLTFVVTEVLNDGFIVQLELPNDIPWNLRRFALTEPMSSKKAARRRVALNALKALYAAGWVSEHLLPLDLAAKMADIVPQQQTENIVSLPLYEPNSSLRHYLLDVSFLGKLQVRLCISLPCYPVRVGDSWSFWHSRLRVPVVCALVEELPGVTGVPLAGTLWDAWVGYRVTSLFELRVMSSETGALWSFSSFPNKLYFVNPDRSPINLAPGDMAPPRPGSTVREMVEKDWKINCGDNTKSFVEAVELLAKVKRVICSPPPNAPPTHNKFYRLLSPDLGHAPSDVPAVIRIAIDVVPSVVRHVSLRSVALQCCRGLKTDDKYVELFEEALACPTARFHFSYQRLETLGDAVLKLLAVESVYRAYPYDEGRLSKAKDLLVSNENLARVFCEGPLASIPIDPRPPDDFAHFAPASGVAWPVKRRADLVESLLGAVWCATESLDECRVAAQWVGIRFPERSEEQQQDEVAFLPLSSLGSCSIAATATGYHFTNRALVAEAFTHASATSQHRNLNRLEFLGDAIIDLANTLFVLHREPQASPARLSDYRYALCSTEGLSLVCHHHRLHEKLEAFSRPLLVQISQFCQECHDLNIWLLNPPKVLADLSESVIGAVFVDCGFQLDVALAAAKRLCFPVWESICDRNCGPPQNPVRLANERFGTIGKLSWDESGQTLYCGDFPLVIGEPSHVRACALAMTMEDEVISLLRKHLG